MIDFQGLLTMLRNAEDEPNVRMGVWLNECGTAGCLIGTFCKSNPQDELKVTGNSWLMSPKYHTKNNESAIAARFGITHQEAEWLFTGNPLKYINEECCTHAMNSSKEGAINRLRKFIYYKLHKQEMVITKGRNNYIVDQKRNLGHVNFVQKALTEACSH